MSTNLTQVPQPTSQQAQQQPSQPPIHKSVLWLILAIVFIIIAIICFIISFRRALSIDSTKNYDENVTKLIGLVGGIFILIAIVFIVIYGA